MMGGMTHRHDWRISPELLWSNPPQQVLVCADCQERKTRAMPEQEASSADPRTWPRA